MSEIRLGLVSQTVTLVNKKEATGLEFQFRHNNRPNANIFAALDCGVLISFQSDRYVVVVIPVIEVLIKNRSDTHLVKGIP